MRTAYLVCRAEDEDHSVFVMVVPDEDAEWVADGLRKVPSAFNAVTVVRKPFPSFADQPPTNDSSAGIA